MLAGRSIYYGAWLYLSQLFGGFWPVAVLQALLTAAAMLATAGRLADRPPGASPRLFAGPAAIALLTGAGFFAAMMMPDIFAALGILAVGHLALFWRTDGGGWRLFWLAMLAFAVLFHAANLLIAGGMLAVMALARSCGMPLFRGIAPWPAIAALLVGVAGEMAFDLAVRRATGQPPVRPPFLTARLVEDGPGTAYLRAHCDPPRFLLCAYRDRLPLGSDPFLWSDDPATGVFSALPADGQRRIAGEQGAFVVAVIREAPLAVLASSARAFLRQLGRGELEAFNYGRAYRETAARKLPPTVFARLQRSRAYRNAMPTGLIDALTPWVSAMSVIAIALALASSGKAKGEAGAEGRRRAHALAVTMVGGVLINALVCGALSTPHGRYQARVLWLLPLAAVSLAQRRRGATPG